MKNIKNCTIACVMTLSVSSFAGEDFGGIHFDSTIPASQRYSIKEDLTYLYNMKFDNYEENFASLYQIKTVDGPQLYNWIYNRVKYIVGQDYKAYGKNFITKKGHEFPSTPLPPVSDFDKTDAYGGVVIMTNVGAGLYLDGKKKKLLRGLKINSNSIYADSSRSGILQVGEGLFMNSILINNDFNSEANKIKRLGTLFHESRHSDGNSEHVGFLHHKCPIGHSLFGFFACEPYRNGAYTLEAVASKNLLKNCKTCSIEDKTKLSAAVADSFDRVVVMTHLKTKEELLQEIESYKKVIDFYVDFIKMSPSQKEMAENEIARYTKMYDESQGQLNELENPPHAKEMSSAPEGRYNEVSVESSSHLIELSLGKY